METWLNEGPGRMSLDRQLHDDAIQICRDVQGGTLRLRDKAAIYLPKFPKEDTAQYRRRVASSVLFNWYKRTVGGLVGMVMRKDPKLEDDVPKGIAAQMDDVDLAGRDLAAFAHDLFAEAWHDGLAVIFVDKPAVPDGATRDQDSRPYWIVVRYKDVLGVTTERIGGRDVVTGIRWREFATETDPADEFKEQRVPRVREYKLVSSTDEAGNPTRRVQWRSWTLRQESEAGKTEWVPNGDAQLLGAQMDEIPVAPVYTGRVAPFDAEPPLLDLAMENLRHYQKLSDRDNVEHVASVPVFVTTGAAKEEVEGFAVGPTTGMALPKGADAKYVEVAGGGLTQSAQSLKDSEHRMAVLGLSMLMSESRAAETATSKQIDKSETDSQLATSAKSLQRGLATALYYHAKWMGLPDGGRVSVNMDFEVIALDAQTITALAALVPAKMSLETFWDLLVQGEILPETFDPDLERTRLEEGDMKQLAALKSIMGQQKQAGQQGQAGAQLPPDGDEGAGGAGNAAA